MRRAKEDDRLFLRQQRRIPAQRREKRSRHPVYTNASTRSKEAAPVARYCRTACASRSIINYRKSDQSKVTRRRDSLNNAHASRSVPFFEPSTFYIFISIFCLGKLCRITDSFLRDIVLFNHKKQDVYQYISRSTFFLCVICISLIYNHCLRVQFVA